MSNVSNTKKVKNFRVCSMFKKIRIVTSMTEQNDQIIILLLPQPQPHVVCTKTTTGINQPQFFGRPGAAGIP
jgi:hypothetical protein